MKFVRSSAPVRASEDEIDEDTAPPLPVYIKHFLKSKKLLPLPRRCRRGCPASRLLRLRCQLTVVVVVVNRALA